MLDNFMKGRVFVAMFDDDIGRKIAVLRKACNVSATELSLAIGKKSHYIYGIEKGYFKPSTGAYLIFAVIWEYRR